jgi:hypothetical protein
MSESTNDSSTGVVIRRLAPPENDLVPFGKYTGQPVDMLLADASYVDWLRSQPGVMEMLQRRSPTVFNILMVGAPKMEDTPEHNALQAKFLEESFQYAFIEAVTKRCVYNVAVCCAQKANEQIAEPLKKATVQVAKECEEAEGTLQKAKQEHAKTATEDPKAFYAEERDKFLAEQRTLKAEGYRWATERDFPAYEEWLVQCDGPNRNTWRVWNSWPYRVKERKQELEKALRSLKELRECRQKIAASASLSATPEKPVIEIEFECGYDLQFKARWWGSVTGPWQSKRELDYRSYDTAPWTDLTLAQGWNESFAIELKPQMGDDFPTVLRQMKRNGADTLVIGSFEATTCTLEQVRAMFGEKKLSLSRKSKAFGRKGRHGHDLV